MTRTNAKRAPSRKPTPKSHCLEVPARAGVSHDRLVSDLVAGGEATNALTAARFVNADIGELSLTDLVASLREHGEAVNRGDLAAAERMLNAQAVALNVMFAELARRAALNMGTHMEATERYLRLALKAQSQSRTTVETLAAIRNPRVVFARQANINNGGQQQVNNGTATAAPGDAGPETGGVKSLAPSDAVTGRSLTHRLFCPDGEISDLATAGTKA